LPLAVWEIASEPRPADLSAETILAVLYIGLFPALGSTPCWNTAVTRVGAGAAGVFMTLIPIFATGLAVPTLGERLEPYHLIALGLVVGGVGLAALRGARSLRQGG
jgi:drug/metabolite transporter (DMT)-like permease